MKPFNPAALHLVFLTFLWPQATSEVGSAGLYLEEYFEEQLKEFYPDRIFPGGREEQMIPPLEDEIEEDEEEETTVEDTAPTEQQQALSPTMGEGLLSLEVKAAGAGAAGECEAAAEKETTTRDRGTDVVVKSEGDAPPAGTAEERQTASEQAPQDSAAAPGERKDAEEPSTAEQENLPLPTDSPVVPPEAQEAGEEAGEEPTATEET